MNPKTLLIATASAMACAFAFSGQALAQQQTKLNILWEVLVNGNDYMTTPNPTERDMFPLRGAFAYVPADAVTGTAPLYRLNNGTDHMDSAATSEGPYALEGAIGNPWTSQSAMTGLHGISRVFNSAVEHASIYSGDTIPGYGSEAGFGRYGYARYNNTAEALNTLSGGGITVSSNNVAGGSVWSWVWNGIEFVDHWDYGREMQSAVLWFANDNPNTTPYNPTEAGAYSPPSVAPALRQGSPMVESYNTGLTQTTRSVPLDFDPTHWGGDAAHPVIYNTMTIGKDVTLDFNGMGNVAQYVTSVSTDTPITAAEIEMPTTYLPQTFGQFHQYDAQSQTLETAPVPGQPNCSLPNAGYRYHPASGYGGLIISNADQSAAMGVYGRSVDNGGDVQDYVFYDFRNCSQTSKWSAFREMNLPAGETHLKVWIVTGTLSDVESKMHQLYVDGVN